MVYTSNGREEAGKGGVVRADYGNGSHVFWRIHKSYVTGHESCEKKTFALSVLFCYWDIGLSLERFTTYHLTSTIKTRHIWKMDL